jgi:hypothetical protein
MRQYGIYLSAGQSEVIALAENGRVKRLPVVSGGKKSSE